MKTTARKTNVTGIKGLSIGSFNNRGFSELTRYIVNYGVGKSKSFYFGENKTQYCAFTEACDFMKEVGLLDEKLSKTFLKSQFFIGYKHSSLI